MEKDAEQDVHNKVTAQDIDAAVQVGNMHGDVHIQPASPPKKVQNVTNSGHGVIITQDGQVNIHRHPAVQDVDSGTLE